MDRTSDAVVDTTSTAVEAIDSLAGDEIIGAAGLPTDRFNDGQSRTQQDDWALDNPVPEEEPMAEDGLPYLSDSFQPLDDYPVGGWVPPELYDEVGGLCHEVNRALEGDFDDLTLTNAKAHSFGLMVELCDLYWADEIAARDR